MRRALRRADDVHVVDVARLVERQLDSVAEAELGVASGASRRPAFQPARWGRKTRSAAAWIASSREFVPIELEGLLVARAVEAKHPDRSATSSSRHATSPPSPSAKRFFVGKKLKVEQTPVRRDAGCAERLRGVLDQRQPERRRARRAAPAGRRGGRA